MSLLWQLFLSFMQIGVLSIGGGYASIPLIQNAIVDANGWITMTEFVDLMTIAEMTPGPIGINAATFVGNHVAGIPGALCATFGFVLPSILIVSFLAFIYFRYRNLELMQGILSGLRPVVVALIASAGVRILFLALNLGPTLATLFADINGISVALFVVSFLILRKWKPSPIVVMFGCGVVGAIVYNL